MDKISKLINEVIDFRDQRDWKQFHNSKDLSIALSVEASELLEVFLWKKPGEANKDTIKEELADVLIYALLLAHEEELDVEEIVQDKLKQNDERYPVGKSKGNAKKYDEL